jgi:hypothetical protein
MVWEEGLKLESLLLLLNWKEPGWNPGSFQFNNDPSLRVKAANQHGDLWQIGCIHYMPIGLDIPAPDIACCCIAEYDAFILFLGIC